PSPRVQRLADEQLHDEERGAVLGDVVVEHAHRALVVDGVGDVALADEARAVFVVERQLLVEQFDRDAVAVPVHAEVDGRHAADADDAQERVLAPEHRAEAVLRASIERAGGDGHPRRGYQLIPTLAPLTFTGPDASRLIGPEPLTETFPLASTFT